MASIYANLLGPKKAFTYEKSSTPSGCSCNSNQAAISLFCNTNMATVTRHVRGTQREYSSKPLKHSIVERILVFKR